MKKCYWCQSICCLDESDVSGLDCRKKPLEKITEPDKQFCEYYQFSWVNFLFDLLGI